MAVDNPTYLALGNSLRLNEQGDLRLVADARAVEHSIENILTTRVGERVMRRGFGSFIHDLLFEPITESIATLIELEIFDQLRRAGEDRVVVDQVTVVPLPDLNCYEAIVAYRLKALNTQSLEFRRVLRRIGEV